MSKGIEFLGADTQKGQWQILKGSTTVDLAQITSPDTVSTTITVTGARLGDPVIIGSSATIVDHAVMTAFVSASDTVTVRLAGLASNPDQGSTTYTVYVFHEKDV